MDTFLLKSAVQRALATRGYEIRRRDPLRYNDLSADDWELWRRVHKYTQTPPGRVAALGDAVETWSGAVFPVTSPSAGCGGAVA